MNDVRIIGVPCARDFAAGDDLAEILGDALVDAGGLQAGDIVVVTQKVVSKCEGRGRALAGIEPSPLATAHAKAGGADARLVELVLSEAARVVRMVRGVLITQTRHGFVCANSGIDESNVERGIALLLPEDSDRSAARLRDAFARRFGSAPAVIVSDTFGRAWRRGQVNVAIGIAGGAPIVDYRGAADPFGRELRATELAVADELASAAELVMNKFDRVPAAVVRGYALPAGEASIGALLRPIAEDLFL